MPDKPEILKVETVARSRLFQIEQLDLRFSNGVETRYERLLGSAAGAVLIVAMPDPETVLLVREYAVGVDRYELGFPKGRIEPGEDALETANRELREETGFGARDCRLLMSLTVAPGYFGHVTHVILATDLVEDPIEGDEPEPVETVPYRLDDMNTLLARDDFTEARSIAALFLVRERLRHE